MRTFRRRRMGLHKPKDAEVQRRVLKHLERRWEDRLPDGRLPEGLKDDLRKLPHFHEMCDRYVGQQGFTEASRDSTPDVRRAGPQGEIVDVMILELGHDPELYHCDECFVEIPRGTGLCEGCRKWLRQEA